MHRYFISSSPGPRVRRATDVMTVVVGGGLVLWLALTADSVFAIEQALLDLVLSLPSWTDGLYESVYFLGGLFVVALLVGAAAKARQRLDLLRDILAALIGSASLALILARWVEGEWPSVLPELGTSTPDPVFPVLRVALVTAIIVASAPHVTRPVRRLGWALVVLLAISGVGLGLGLPGDAVGGVALGLVAGGGVLVLFGSPGGYPDLESIAIALGDLGLDVHDLEFSSEQTWGVRRLSGRLEDGSPISVKAYGRDATDSQLLEKAWHGLWFREGGGAIYGRQHGVEREALAMLLSRRSGVATPEVLAVGVGGDEVALLATSVEGEPLDDSGPSSETLLGIWRQVARLHGDGIAHGALTLRAIRIGLAGPTLGEMQEAVFRASPSQLSRDVTSLLYETATIAGTGAAVDAARRGLSDDRLVEALPYLQLPSLTRAQRKLTAKPKGLLEELRRAAATATGTELPEPAKLRRINWKDLVVPALSLVAGYALIGMLSDIDFAAVWDVVQDAAWIWILVGFIIGQFVFLPEATGMMYATGYPLPLRPLVVLQVSVKWIGLAIPSAAGRVAMNTVFLRKYGVPPTIAVVQGAIDGISGFVVEAGILVVAFLASDLSLDLDTTEVEWQLILLIVLVVIAAGIFAILRVQRVRDVLIPVLREATSLLGGVLRDPKRTIGLLVSNLTARLVLALTLWFILQAISAPLPLVTALVVTVATNLLAGLVPIPGGIGVAEAVLTSFLVVAGLTSEEAFAAAVVFRLATFYIPAGAGFFAMKWLRSGGYL